MRPTPSIDPTQEQDIGRGIVKDTLEVGPEVERDGVQLSNRRVLLAERLQAKPGAISGKNKVQSYPVTIAFRNVNVRTAMEAFAKLTDANILVGDEVKGKITAQIRDEPWDQALNALLNMKNLASAINPDTGLMSIRSRTELTQTENFQKQREEALQSAQARESAFLPIKSEIFRLYYADPEKIKTQIEEMYKTQGGDQQSVPIQVSVISRLRALVVKGTADDIEFINKYITQVDVATQQVLIEAFIVEATNNFEQELGSRLGFTLGGQGGTAIQDTSISGLGGGPAASGIPMGDQLGSTLPALIPGAAPGSIANLPASVAAGGIGILQKGSTADLKVELTAMEQENLGRIVSNPKVFTLDNQPALIQQGTQIPYQTTSAQGTQTQFVDATLKLEVTPSIVGDGNIVLALKVNKDSPLSTGAAQPPISKMEVTTQLLMKTGQIAVIGGVFSENRANTITKVPLLGDLPWIGWLFRNTSDEDKRKQIFIFVSPQIL